jgi:hypothetical protein
MLVENRNGLIAAAMATQADGHAERDAALLMRHQRQKDRSRRITVGADKAYDTRDFITASRELNVTMHVQKNEKTRRSSLDCRTTRHPGYARSLSRRWLIEKIRLASVRNAWSDSWSRRNSMEEYCTSSTYFSSVAFLIPPLRYSIGTVFG